MVRSDDDDDNDVDGKKEGGATAIESGGGIDPTKGGGRGGRAPDKVSERSSELVRAGEITVQSCN